VTSTGGEKVPSSSGVAPHVVVAKQTIRTASVPVFLSWL
jgi:hypothetical protein